MRVIVTGLFMLSFCVIEVHSQISPDMDRWFHGPVRYLMTDADDSAWRGLRSDAEAEEFIALFWARRDPTPGTPENEWRAEFDVRVGLADAQFSTLRTQGSMTDRGKVLILLGAPSQVGSRGAAGRATNAGAGAPGGPGGGWDGQVASARPEPARQVWTYSGDRKPQFITQKELELVFVDDSGRGEFTVASTERVNINHILQEAVRHLIFSPDLDSIPMDMPASMDAAVPRVDFGDPSLRQAYEEAVATGQTSRGSAFLSWGEFVTTEGTPFVAVQLYAPAGSGAEAGQEMTFVGVFEVDGEPVQIAEVPMTLMPSGRDVYVDHSFEVRPGTYAATFGLARDGVFETMRQAQIEVVGIDPHEAGISPMILSNNAHALPQGQLATDPFAFGGLKVVPKGDLSFRTSDELWYWFELRNPGLTEAGAPKVRIKVDIEGTSAVDQQTQRWEFPPQEVETIPLKGAENRFGLGMAFPLTDFVAGDYTIRIGVFDAVLRKNYSDQKAFVIR